MPSISTPRFQSPTTSLDEMFDQEIAWARASRKVKHVFTEIKAPPLTPSWHSAGYVALALRQVCRSCSGHSTHVEGIFHVETGPTGRRLTRVPANGQWPLQAWPLELREESVEYCLDCLVALDFKPTDPSTQRTVAIY